MRKLARALPVGLAATVLVAAVAADAAWTSTGSASAVGTATSVAQANAPTVTAGTGKATVSWTASTLANGAAVGGYRVFRHVSGGRTEVCTAVSPSLTCDDTTPAGSAVEYGVVAYRGDWTGPESALTPFSYDTTAPATTMTFSPAANPAGYHNTDVVVTLTATDAGAGVASVTYAVNGSPTTVNAASTSFTIGSEGTTSLTYFATDQAGNVEPTHTAPSFRIDKTAPAAPSLDATISADTGSSSTDRVTRTATQTLTGAAEANSTVRLYRGSALVGTASASGAGRFSIGVTLAEGANSFTVDATDVADNVSLRSAALVVILDTVAPAKPAITAISNDTGSSGSDGVTRTAAQTVSGTAEAGSVVTLKQGASTAGTATANASGVWSVSVTLASGTNSFTATTVDAAGNTSPASDAYVAVLDTSASAPTVTQSISADTGSSTSDRVTNVASQTLTGTAEAGASVTVTRGGAAFTGTADGSGAWSITVTLVEGANSLSVAQVDPAGNTSAGTSVPSISLDTTLPTGSFTSPANGASLTSNSYKTGCAAANFSICGVAADTLGTNPSGLSTVTVSLSRSGSSVFTDQPATGTASWSYLTGNLTSGSYVATAKVTDKAGNLRTVTSSFTIS